MLILRMKRQEGFALFINICTQAKWAAITEHADFHGIFISTLWGHMVQSHKSLLTDELVTGYFKKGA